MGAKKQKTPKHSQFLVTVNSSKTVTLSGKKADAHIVKVKLQEDCQDTAGAS